jgi:hypothetical protein
MLTSTKTWLGISRNTLEYSDAGWVRAATRNPPSRQTRRGTFPPRRQSGAVLLLSLLVFLTAAAFVLVSQLNKAVTQAYRGDQTRAD